MSLQDMSVPFPTWMSLWKVVLRTLWVIVITRLFALFLFFPLWVSESTESIVQLMAWFALDIIANFGILPVLSTRAPPQELLVPAHWGYMSTGTCAHGFVVDFDSWASFSFSIPCCIWTCHFYNPRYDLLISSLFYWLSLLKKKKDWLLIHGTGIRYHHQFPPNVHMRNFGVHIIGPPGKNRVMDL